MSSADQRRKRKRILRHYYYYNSDSPLLSLRHLFSVRSLLLCFSFLTLVYILPHSIPLASSAFHPVLVVSSLSLLSSSSSSSTRAESVDEFGGNLLQPPKVESRVLFPDHVLLLIGREKIHGNYPADELECVYHRHNRNITVRDFSEDLSVKNVLSFDDYDEFRAIVRCPLPPVNYSSADVILKWKDQNRVWIGNNQTGVDSCSWDNVVYAAAMDKNTAVVFVKGLNLRPGRESNPNLFTCHFGFGNGKYVVRTSALTAAQEVVRCPIPTDLRSSSGLSVTVGVRRGPRGRTLMQSVARIFNSLSEKERRIDNGKFELCVCTMAWNQASAIREWIMYHSWLGVERWFVYDNNSEDGMDEVVRALDRENYNVTRHVWPWIKTQEGGFSHCAIRARDECEWVAFMDVDEYFYFPYATPKHLRFRKSSVANKHALRDLLANISSSSLSSRPIAEIRTTCHSFGPSGLTVPPPQGVTVGYTCRLQSPERHKSIVKPEALDTTLLNVVHHFYLRKGFKYINLPQNTAIINHYKYQVWEVFRAKFYRRVATYVADWQQNQNEGSRDRVPGLGTEAIEPPDWPQKFCEVWDSGLRDFVLAMLPDSSTGLLPWEMTTTITTTTTTTMMTKKYRSRE
ncbi:glycosyltransferase family 92 protein RCOM_0530710-like [Andrographis paniculata]|uniref:glycosyltransferase family 92 protein RCOM_0530710-like n=1 Tax=Andrographis paniculata TaxID=175694 RepID=UPI0021E72BAB|nr:glycosyltransferase family 92 protein RCOM_0530710-like [Andrographis paniculata]